MVLFTIITRMFFFFIEFNTILIVHTSCSLEFFLTKTEKNIYLELRAQSTIENLQLSKAVIFDNFDQIKMTRL